MGLPLIRIRDVGQPFSGTFYSGEFRDEFLVSKGDYLISMDGNFRVAAWSSKPALLNQRVSRLQFYIKGLGEAFLAQTLQLKLLHLQGIKAYTTVDHLSAGQIKNCVIGFPSLREQHRIVAKVDELMSLCDALEAQTESSITAHQTLVEVLLEALLKAPEEGATPEQSTAQFQQNWQRLSEHFDTLFTTTASIDTLKQTILQLAVMGKLVPQNPNDEPAAKLLERIAAEKAQLIKDKKIKKQKPLPEITDEEKPFELPQGWAYTRLDDLCATVSSGSTPPKSELSETGDIPFLKVYNIQNQEIEFKQRTLFVTKDAHMGKLNRSILYPGDVIMNLVGPPLGKVAIMPSTYPEWNCNQNIVCFRPLELELNKYIYTYLKSHLFLDYIILVGSAGQDFISGTKCRAIALPMPPLSEQHRIVARVDELLALCDQLKARLTDAQTTKLHLTDAIVEQAL
ncbi:restriction endonuclease subunit S [Pseudoalteromonas sp. AOP31-A2-14]|uniref:restriction endonuclease subunit S n=1 Tax=Pseudoalteromonas sp. AOP31-A2-14 TaxID=3457695 RepID=UPI00403592B5